MRTKLIALLFITLSLPFVSLAHGLFIKAENAQGNALAGSSQSSDDILTITVCADGLTKQEAIDNALRNAIEQSYGAFISSDTKILNDQIVKDEIISVSHGNIHRYEENSCYFNIERATYEVTITVQVSLTNLRSYAESKGAAVEFAGFVFANNVKRYMLNKDNERQIMKNLIELVLCSNNIFDLSLKINEPRSNLDGSFSLTGLVEVSLNSQGQALFDYVRSTIASLGMSEEERSFALKTRLGVYSFIGGQDVKGVRISYVEINTSQSHKRYAGLFPSFIDWLFPSKNNGFLDRDSVRIPLRNSYVKGDEDKVLLYDAVGGYWRWVGPDYFQFEGRIVSLREAFDDLLAKRMLDFYVIPTYSDGRDGANVLKRIEPGYIYKGSIMAKCSIELEPMSLNDLERLTSLQAAYDYYDADNWKKENYWPDQGIDHSKTTKQPN